MTSYAIPQSDSISPADAPNVLVATPSAVVRQRVLESLHSPVRCFEHARGGAEALVYLENGSWQTLFLDRRLPDLDAEELSLTVRQLYPEVEVVLLDDDELPAEGESASEPILDSPASKWSADESLERLQVERLQVVGQAEPLPGMIGRSAVIQPVYRLVRLLAARNTTVLITGPTGSGKEVVARAIHQLSSRSSRPFAVVNCAAIPETLLEAELFGYARGAFTGAMQAYAGRIQAANGGTLFLDEIGEMPLSLQPKLLRFLEQKEVQRLGSSEVVRVDARIVSATNAHLLSLVREGKFREDLYYRLCGFPIAIPPLRERPDDIAQLAAHFLEKCADSFSARNSPPQLSMPALQILKNHPWAGNIRELQNVMERALILAEGRAMIRPEHLMLSDSSCHAMR
jgi:transcriptional regulator with GAF, ATPase, and Fis domain